MQHASDKRHSRLLTSRPYKKTYESIQDEHREQVAQSRDSDASHNVRPRGCSCFACDDCACVNANSMHRSSHLTSSRHTYKPRERRAERPLLLEDHSPLRSFDEVQCIPSENVENKTIESRRFFKVCIAICARVSQNKTRSVVSRARTKSSEREEQSFPRAKYQDQLPLV